MPITPYDTFFKSATKAQAKSTSVGIEGEQSRKRKRDTDDTGADETEGRAGKGMTVAQRSSAFIAKLRKHMSK